jgi:ankyrin repeat protein
MMLAAGMNPNVTAIYDFGVGVSSKEGAFVRNTDLDISTALISAAANGQAETLQLLLAAKADPNRKTQKGHTALIFASWRGHLEAVKALLAGGATVDLVSGEGYTALRAAAVNGNTDTLQTLLDRGANVKNPANLTIVQDTACKDHVDAVRILLEHGVPIDDKPGQTPALYCAARSGNERMLTLLLDKGANINLKNQGDQNRTPLIIAAANGRLGAIRLLLDRNADLDATSNPSGNYTYTALLHALGPLQNYRTQGSLGSQRERDNTEIVNLLLARGANANLGWYNNDTALIFAARNGWADIVKTLVEKGANVNATTRTGNETALTVAAKYPDVRQILISAGAR